MRLSDLICMDPRQHSNLAMVARLRREGALTQERTALAFLNVDRGEYIHAESEDLKYMDMPIKIGNVHLSAPSIYAAALEALDVQPGMSFLHLGSGTGYFCAVVAELAGRHTVNHGIEHKPDLIARAREQAAERGLTHVDFFEANAFQLDVVRSMRYDRIYLSGAVPEDPRLFDLLREGGVLVAPFDSPDTGGFNHGAQHLVRAARGPDGTVSVERLQAVQFARLVRPPREELAALPQLALQPPGWSPAAHPRFPPEFRRMVLFLLWANDQPDTLLARVPKDIILRVVASCDFFAFRPPAPGPLTAAPEAEQAAPGTPPAVHGLPSVSSSATGSTEASDASSPEEATPSHAAAHANGFGPWFSRLVRPRALNLGGE